MENKKKILFYIGSLGKGGAERVVSNLVNYLCRRSFSIVVVTDQRDSDEYDLDSAVLRIVLPQYNSGNRLMNIYKRLRDIRRAFKENHADIVFSFAGKCNKKALLAGLGSGIPIVPSVRSDPKREYGDGCQAFYAKLLFLTAKSAVFQTNQARDFFFQSTQKKSVVLFNPLEEKFMKPVYEGVRKNEIVSVGSLRKVKNHEMLLQAFALIAKEFSEITLTIYGEGDCRSNLENLAKEKGIADRVFLPGNSAHIEDMIDKSRIFVLSSNVEGMPNALMEAMALGLAVISTDCPCGGPATLIEDGVNGLLIPVGDTDALAGKLRFILSNPEQEKKLQQNAASIRDICNSKKVLEQWEKYIYSL